MTKPILDISEFQTMTNPKACVNATDFIFVRVQYGSAYEDNKYKGFMSAINANNGDMMAYAWVRGTSVSDMRSEAKTLYSRARPYHPKGYMLDLEERSMNNMRSGAEAFRAEIAKLDPGKPIVAYIGQHLYASFNINVSKFDAVMIPNYGINNGQPVSTPIYFSDIHQYTSVGRVSGISGNVDLSRYLHGMTHAKLFGGSAKPGSSSDARLDYVKPKTYTYFGYNPRRVRATTTVGVYKDKNLKTKARNAKKSTLFVIDKVVKSDGGAPRLQTDKGEFLSARRDLFINWYYEDQPKAIKSLTNIGLYTDASLAHKKATLGRGEYFNITAVSGAHKGATRLKTESGLWVSGNKDIVQAISHKV